MAHTLILKSVFPPRLCPLALPSPPLPCTHPPFPQISTHYDLYSAVYHVGALGGGHYIATGRDMSDHLLKIITAEQEEGQQEWDEAASSTRPSHGREPQQASGSSPSSTPKAAAAVQWWCYNDSSVTPVTAEKDIVSSSAYVLFYLRKDIQNSRFQDIHRLPSSLDLTGPVNKDSAEPSPSSPEPEESKSARTILGESMSEAKNKLSRLIPPALATSRVSGGVSGGGGEEEEGNGEQSENQDNCQIS
jgi:hypothetical protein